MQRENQQSLRGNGKGWDQSSITDRSDGYFYLTDKWLNGRRMYGLYLNVEAAAA